MSSYSRNGFIVSVTTPPTVSSVAFAGIDIRQTINANYPRTLTVPIAFNNTVQRLADQLFTTIREFDEVTGDFPLSVEVTNYFFESFTALWAALLSAGGSLLAAQVMLACCELAWNWEARNQPYRIHKGTPLFFLAKAFIEAGNLDSGFLLFHNALEEDKRTYPRLPYYPQGYRAAPAYLFAGLNANNPNTAMRQDVVRMRTRMDRFIQNHNSLTGATFNYSTFDSKFIQNPALEEPKFFFVFTLMSILRNEDIMRPQLVSNAFSKLRNTDTIFNLCLVIDRVFRELYPNVDYISQSVTRYCFDMSWVTEQTARRLLAQLNYSPQDRNPDVLIPILMANGLRYRGRATNPVMTNMMLAWHLRNYGAHNIGGSNVLVADYESVLDRLMSALFSVVESLP